MELTRKEKKKQVNFNDFKVVNCLIISPEEDGVPAVLQAYKLLSFEVATAAKRRQQIVISLL